MIVGVFKELDNIFNRHIGDYQNSKESTKTMNEQFEAIEQTIIKFLQNFIYPTSSLSQLEE